MNDVPDIKLISAVCCRFFFLVWLVFLKCFISYEKLKTFGVSRGKKKKIIWKFRKYKNDLKQEREMKYSTKKPHTKTSTPKKLLGDPKLEPF